MKRALKILLPLIVLVVSTVGAGRLMKTAPRAARAGHESLVPMVRVIFAEPATIPIRVETQGTVRPRTESSLVPEVSGRICYVSPSLRSGGFFEEGDVLMKIDSRDYEEFVTRTRAKLVRAHSAVTRTRFLQVRARGEIARARADVAQAKRQLARSETCMAREEAEAATARQEWKRVGEGEASPLTLHEPQLAEARAQMAHAEEQLSSARAALETAIAEREALDSDLAAAKADVVSVEAEVRRAERDLRRTELRAPFVGRARSLRADLGQFVSRGTPVAGIFAVDSVEVRLPLPDEELAFLDLPLSLREEKAGMADGALEVQDNGAFSGRPGEDVNPTVDLFATFAGRRHQWVGRITRTEGEIDARSRLVHAVARVRDPYGQPEGMGDRDRPPLSVGMFVEAVIHGRTFEGVFPVPRLAMRDRTRLLVVDDEERLRFREVSVLRAERERVLIRSGLTPGERICISPLEIVVDGMKVEVADAAAPGERP